jgi:hypothetical protein
MKKRRTFAPDGSAEYGFTSRREQKGQVSCAWPGCPDAGVHRAPVSRDALNQYLWFCKRHARDYNGAWDYFQGMSREEILKFQDRNATWHRPTWRIGGNGAWPENVSDPHGLFREHVMNGSKNGHARAAPPWTHDERRALAALGLDEAVTFEEIKSRYKKLVKRWHPDANGNDPAAGDRLKRINAAYACLRSAVRSRGLDGTATL